MRETSNGKLFVPARGKPPEPPVGYERDSEDPYMFVPILVNCVHRTLEQRVTACCTSRVMYCSYLGKRMTNYRVCKDCGSDVAWCAEHFGLSGSR